MTTTAAGALTPDELREIAEYLDEGVRDAERTACFAETEGYPDGSLLGNEESEVYIARLFRDRARRMNALRRRCYQAAVLPGGAGAHE